MSQAWPRPAHLAPAYAAQFEDVSVAAAYHTRPPYPVELFQLLGALQPAGGVRAILDLGCGTGDVTLGLRGHAARIDAVDPSAAMLAVARRRRGARHPALRWIRGRAETCALRGPYSLVVAGDSLHWMEWSVVMPRLAGVLAPDAMLAIVTRDEVGTLPWAAELQELVRRHSTNREFRPYDLIEEIVSRGLFHEAGRRVTASVEFAQPLADYVESFHSRNGFSRQRMASAGEFDAALGRLVTRWCGDGVVRRRVAARVVWGRPAAG